METRVLTVLRRGMVAGVLMGLVPIVVGCVSRSAFEAEVEKNQHLQYVKTEQDIEREGLHADVGALRRVYSDQSLRMTFLEGVVQQTSIELKQIDAKLSVFDAKLTALSQEAKQQQGEVVRVGAQGVEAIRLLESMKENQEKVRQDVVGVATTLAGMKKVVTSRPVAIPAESPDVKSKGKGEKAETVAPMKGAVGEQKLSSRPVSDGKDVAPTSGGDAKKDSGVGDGNNQVGASLADPASEGGEAPVMAGKVPPVAQGGESGTLGVSHGNGANTSDTGDRSPLITSTSGPAVSSESGTPVKKTWADWASDKFDAAKQKVMGKKPVQTAADSAGGTPPNGKK